MPEKPPNNAISPQDRPEPSEFVPQPVKTVAIRPTVINPAPATSMPAKKSFYQENKWYVWAIAAGLAILGILAYLVFRKPAPAPATEARVNISISVPESVPSGGEAVYSITVRNEDTQKLVNVRLELAYPDGFTYISSAPNDADNLSGSMFSFPDLSPGQNVAEIVKVRAAGNVNDSKQLTARLHYKYSNFNSEFVKEQVATVRLVASDINLTIDGPATTNNAQLVQYTVKYQNNSSEDTNTARMELVYPDGFKFASADPQPNLSNNIWNIGKLARGAEGEIHVQGTFNSSSPGESKTLTANFSILGSSGDYFVQNSGSFVTVISSLPLVLVQTVDQGGDSGVVKPGDTLTYHIHYQNNATVVATGVIIQASLDSKALDLGSIQAEGAQVNNNTITWNASSASQLASLAPNQSGDLNFQVRVNNPAIKDSSKNLSVVSHVQIKANEYDNFPGPDLTLKISSPSSITVGLDYASGSLPPKVGQDTAYTVTLTLRNATNDYSNTAVSMFIPLGAGGFVSGSANPSSETGFDPATGKLTWNVGNLPAHTGQFSQPRTLTFQVRLNPSSNQAGTSPVLVKGIQYQATDQYTNQTVTGGADDINTSSLSGSNSYSQGQVQP